IGVDRQKKEEIENPGFSDLYEVGTVAKIMKLIKMPDGSKSIVIQGQSTFKADEFLQKDPFFKAIISPYPRKMDVEGVELDASIRSVKETATKIVNLSPNIPSEASIAIDNINSPKFLLNFIASNLNVSASDKQEVLEIRTFSTRMKRVMEFLNKELQVLSISEEIRTKVKSDIDDQQRDFYLRQQKKAIQEALGEGGEHQEVQNLSERAKEKDLPEEAQETVDKQITRLERTPNSSPNYGVIHSYIEWILNLPWNTFSDDNLDLEHAQSILDEDHYGLEKVKERIIEYLAVLKLNATGNSFETIPAPLRDRMEIINISGYTLQEKSEIAKTHLLPKQIEENGLSEGQIKISHQAIGRIIERYTRESGVRSLERQ